MRCFIIVMIIKKIGNCILRKPTMCCKYCFTNYNLGHIMIKVGKIITPLFMILFWSHTMSEYTQKFNEEKATEAASILLHLNGGKMNYMKMIKLLYFIDRKALEKWERPVTYDTYYSMKQGQILSTVLDLAKNKIKGKYWHNHIAKSGMYSVELISEHKELKKLSPAEVELIESVYGELGKHDQFDLGRRTKEGAEYQETQTSIQTTLDNLLSALKYDNEDIERIKETLGEKAYLDALFEV